MRPVWQVLYVLYEKARENVSSSVLPSYVLLALVDFRLLRGYTFKAGSYIYVNAPIISRVEWHPFSIIQVPGESSKAAFYAEAVSSLSVAEFLIATLRTPSLNCSTFIFF